MEVAGLSNIWDSRIIGDITRDGRSVFKGVCPEHPNCPWTPERSIEGFGDMHMVVDLYPGGRRELHHVEPDLYLTDEQVAAMDQWNLWAFTIDEAGKLTIAADNGSWVWARVGYTTTTSTTHWRWPD